MCSPPHDEHPVAGGCRLGEDAYSTAGLVRDKSSNLYGTASVRGANHGGTHFKLAPDGTDTILYAFGRRSGKHSYVGVIRDRNGNLYGATDRGPNNAYGAVFRLRE